MHHHIEGVPKLISISLLKFFESLGGIGKEYNGNL